MRVILALCCLSYLSVDGDPRSVVLGWLKGTRLFLITQLKSTDNENRILNPVYSYAVNDIQYKGEIKIATDPHMYTRNT
jgi:hypothetical protein